MNFKEKLFEMFPTFEENISMSNWENESVDSWVNRAFYWSSTKEGFNYWVKADKKWRKFVMEKDKKIISFNIGCEWEFWTDKNIPQDIIEEYNIYREYYPNMWELNNFLAKNLTTKKEIFNFLTDVLNKVKELKNKLKENDIKMYISSKAYAIDSKSLVFNGLHIHISINTEYFKNSTLKAQQLLQIANKQLIAQKISNLPTLRCLLSHHIWGAYRNYSYNYKQKTRFKPCIKTLFNTVEFRIFDVEDVIYKKNRMILSDMLFNLYSNLKDQIEVENVNFPYIENGEDIEELYTLIIKTLKDKKIARFSILKECEEYAIVKSNYQKVKFDFENKCLKLI